MAEQRYGRGVAGAAQGGGTGYKSFQAKEMSAYLTPEQRAQYEGAVSTMAGGGMSGKQRRKAEKLISKGKRKKSFRKLKKGFGKMAEAEETIGRLRELAAGQAMGEFKQHAAQYSSKPWEVKAPQGLLQQTEVNPYDYSAWAGRQSGGKVQRAFGQGEGGVRGRIASLVSGRGFGQQDPMTFNQFSSADAPNVAAQSGTLTAQQPTSGMVSNAAPIGNRRGLMSRLGSEFKRRAFGMPQYFST